MVRYYVPTSKLECVCHVCRWADFYWTEAECKTALRAHIWQEHSPIPKPDSNDRLPSPGR